MQFTITFSWWLIPTLITIIGLIYALFIHDDGSRGYLSGLSNLFMLVPVLVISCIAWIIAAILK